MTSPQEGLSLALVVHDDAYLPVVSLTDGWGEGYQKKAAVVRLAKADMEKLGLKPGGRVEITGPAASVVVVARPEASVQAGMALMPWSLYTNRLAQGEAGRGVWPPRHMAVRAAAAEQDVTPVGDLMVIRDHA